MKAAKSCMSRNFKRNVTICLALIEQWLDIWRGFYFDWKFGVNTEGLVEPQQLDAYFPNVRFSKRYQPTHISVLQRVFKYLETLDRRSVFYDFGHGRGRVLIAAAQAGFQSLVGVEFSEKLFNQSRCNIDGVCRKFSWSMDRFTLIFDDAANVKIATNNNIFFFYNPFAGPVLRQVLENIVSSSPSIESDIFVFVNLQQQFLLELLGYELIALSPHINTNRIISIYRAKKKPLEARG